MKEAPARYILCGDLGGTFFRTAVVKIKTKAGSRTSPALTPSSLLITRTPSRASVRRGIADQLLASAQKFLQHHPHAVLEGTALAVAGPVWGHRILLQAPNIAFLRERCPLDLAQEIAQAISPAIGEKRVLVINDLEAALAGERERGALRSVKWGLLENIGTGWGGAAIYNGVEVAAEPGHIWIPAAGKCGCGKAECAEARYSGAAIAEAVAQHYGKQAPPKNKACWFVQERAREGNSWARKYLEEVARGIGQIWGSRLNLCPLITKIVYQGSAIRGFMTLRFFNATVRQQLLARSMFPRQHRKVTLEEAKAESKQGTLCGAASIFTRTR